MKHVFLFLVSLAFSARVFSQTANVPLPDTPVEAVFWQPVNVFVAAPDNAVIETLWAYSLSYPACFNRFSAQFAIADDAFKRSFDICKPKAFFRYYLSVASRSGGEALTEIRSRRSYAEAFRRPMKGHHRNRNF
jgi:hypothetical protein